MKSFNKKPFNPLTTIVRQQNEWGDNRNELNVNNRSKDAHFQSRHDTRLMKRTFMATRNLGPLSTTKHSTNSLQAISNTLKPLT